MKARPHQPTPFRLGLRSSQIHPLAFGEPCPSLRSSRPSAPPHGRGSLPPLCSSARPSPSPRLEAGPSLTTFARGVSAGAGSRGRGGCRRVRLKNGGDFDRGTVERRSIPSDSPRLPLHRCLYCMLAGICKIGSKATSGADKEPPRFPTEEGGESTRRVGEGT